MATNTFRPTLPRRLKTAARLAAVVVITALLIPSMAGAASPDAADRSPAQSDEAPQVTGVTVEVLAGHTSYPDAIDARFKLKLADNGFDTNCPPDRQRWCPPRQRGTEVYNLGDPTHTVVARLTWEDGGVVPWHTHPGPVLVSVVKGSLVITYASDCVAHVYEAGEGFLGPGSPIVHMGQADGETVVYATFFDVPAGGKPTTLVDVDPGC